MKKGPFRFLFSKKFYVFDSLESARNAIPEGKAIRIHLDDRELCLTRKGDHFFAFDNHCPHKGLPMHQGILENDAWVCPFHRYCFSLKNGKNLTVQHPGRMELFKVGCDRRGVYVRG
jgi:3-phenylpropionate/trans-cinnamate dioxygenase ferredoxin subunit